MQHSPASLSCSLCLTATILGTVAAQDVSYRRGDTNLDGRISLGDVLQLNAYLCLYGMEPGCLAAADVNANGKSELSDAVAIYRAIFLGDTSVFEPSPACASSPDTSLACDAAAACVAPAAPPVESSMVVFMATEPEAPGPPASEVSLRGQPGDRIELPLFVHIAGELAPGRGAQGWSLGVRAESDAADAAIVGATVEGTVAERYFSSGLQWTGLTEPGGAATAVTLSIIEPRMLPLSPPQAVLACALRLTVPPQGKAGVVTVRVVGGLPGPGGPVDLEVGNAWRIAEPVSVPLTIRVAGAGPAGRFIRGDANRDDVHDISDALATLGALFLGTVTLTCPDAADANDDGKIDVSDPATSLGCLFLGAACPAAPYPACGVDATTDDPFACDGAELTCP